MSNGIENFLKNLPAETLKENPELKSELTEIAPELSVANNPCEAGALASDALEDIFSTEFSEE